MTVDTVCVCPCSVQTLTYATSSPFHKENSDAQTPLDIAEERSYDECVELVSPVLPCSQCCQLVYGPQLQDAVKKKFTKCDHIDVDWGVGEEEEDIYQTPVVDSLPTGTMKKSDTTGDLADKDKGLPHSLGPPQIRRCLPLHRHSYNEGICEGLGSVRITQTTAGINIYRLPIATTGPHTSVNRPSLQRSYHNANTLQAPAPKCVPRPKGSPSPSSKNCLFKC